MHKAIYEYVNNGTDVVIDYILYDKKWLKYLRESFTDLKVYIIKVNISLEGCEKREKSRGTSPIGHSRSHYNEVYENMIYDFEIDNENKSAEENALLIKNYINANPDPKSFSKMKKKIWLQSL
jgi:chloramphenicol 3-O-phosphotransferase